MRYTLYKLSHKGWQLKSDHIEHIRWMLERHVCSNCKWTRADYDQYIKSTPWETEDEKLMAEECLDDDRNPYSFCDFFPENYKDLTEEEKIDLLMQTACGCEFDFVDSEDPESGKHFVEITI
jgi:hypothetical protein